MRAALILVVPAMIFSSAALAADQMTLRCRGWTKLTRPSGSMDSGLSEEYRIDLKEKKWCRGKCERIRPLIGFGESWMTLAEYDGTTFKERIRIDRRTGKLIEDHTAGDEVRRSELTCTAEPFKPFPKPLF